MEDCDLEDAHLANKHQKAPVLLQNRPYKTTTYCKSNGKPKFLMPLSENYDFVFTKYEAALINNLYDA